MKISKKAWLVKSIATLTAVATFYLVVMGSPEQKEELVTKINSHISELYQTVNGTDGAKASFLAHGFCFDGTLEQLALEAHDEVEIDLVENLGRDCRIVTGFINS